MVLQDAFEAAQRFLDEQIRDKHDVEIVIGECKERDDEWCFGYNSRATIEEENISLSLVGNGPIIVPKSGAAPYIGSVFDVL